MSRSGTERPCPCGGGSFKECCVPSLAAEDWPPTAEALMRSRYTAFALGDADHLWRTWHPRTRPPAVEAGRLEWTGLDITARCSGLRGLGRRLRDRSAAVARVRTSNAGRRPR